MDATIKHYKWIDSLHEPSRTPSDIMALVMKNIRDASVIAAVGAERYVLKLYTTYISRVAEVELFVG